MNIAIGSDGSGFDLKEAIKQHLQEKGIDFKDFSPDRTKGLQYFDVVPIVAPLIQNGEFDYAILICGTGMGMAMIANSYKGIRAAVCESVYTVKMCRAINNSNVLTLGGFIQAPWLANIMVDTFLSTQITEAEGLEAYRDFLLDAQLKIKELEEKIYLNDVVMTGRA